jgi:hypothetical protein
MDMGEEYKKELLVYFLLFFVDLILSQPSDLSMILYRVETTVSLLLALNESNRLAESESTSLGSLKHESLRWLISASLLFFSNILHFSLDLNEKVFLCFILVGCCLAALARNVEVSLEDVLVLIFFLLIPLMFVAPKSDIELDNVYE